MRTMETFVTVVVLMAMIALGVLLVHMANRQRGDRIAAFHRGRSWAAAWGRRTWKGVG
ncbi:hypothetical protein AB0H86_00320 [Streptomyces sp. NPDC050997]|uniref:hypothetical protein n=1 Tax=Streptomyces sp. NPDC050997 TaxID=3155519 RepID=UPI0034360D2B